MSNWNNRSWDDRDRNRNHRDGGWARHRDDRDHGWNRGNGRGNHDWRHESSYYEHPNSRDRDDSNPRPPNYSRHHGNDYSRPQYHNDDRGRQHDFYGGQGGRYSETNRPDTSKSKKGQHKKEPKQEPKTDDVPSSKLIKREREPTEMDDPALPVVVKKDEPNEKKPKIREDEKQDDSDWWETKFIDKIKSQIVNFMELHIMNEMEEHTILMDKVQWLEKKKAAAKATWKDIKEILDKNKKSVNYDEQYESDSCGSEAPYNDHNMYDPNANDMYQSHELESFIKYLPYNVVFDAGFLVKGVHPDDEKHCYCPCGKHMRKWREMYGLCRPIGNDQCTSFKKSSPDALISHLETECGKGGMLHQAINIYLNHLYHDFWDTITPGVSHKGLYKRGTKEFERAVSAEKKYYVQAVESHRAVIAAKNKELARQKEQEETIQELRTVNKDRALQIKKLSEAFGEMNIHGENASQKPSLVYEIRDKLDAVIDGGMKNFTPANRTLILDLKAYVSNLLDVKGVKQEEIDAYRNPVKSIIKDMKQSITGELKEKDEVQIRMPQDVNIQKLFDEWYDLDEKQDSTCLFKDLVTYTKDGKIWRDHTKKVLWPWVIDMSQTVKDLTRQKKVLKDMTAIDEGGPTRAFISAFNDQMGDLFVSLTIKPDWMEKSNEPTNEIKVKLFDRNVVPVITENFKAEVARKVKPEYCKDALIELTEKARKYYRAIGRMFIHIICNDEDDTTSLTISTAVMPGMFKNILLRGVLPADKSYSWGDLMIDIEEIGEKNTKEWVEDDKLTFENIGLDQDDLDKYNCDPKVKLDDRITWENYKDKFTTLCLLNPRELAIDSLREGITLGGRMNIQKLLSVVPSKVVSRLFFSNPNYDVDDIVKVMKPEYLSSDSSAYMNGLLDHQKKCFEDILPKVLKKMAKERPNFLIDFVNYVTGTSYLPHIEANPNFKIIVAFSSVLQPTSLPTANTCENQFNLPVDSYMNDTEMMEEKFEIAFALGGNTFGIQ